MPLSGLLCQYGFDGGWSSVFYCFGAASLIWFILYSVLVYDDTASHPRISREEPLYIQRSIGASKGKFHTETKPVPWCAILSSQSVWALMISFFAIPGGVLYTVDLSTTLYERNITIRY